MLRPAYRYKMSVIRVIDGDSVVARIDLGFHVFIETHLRVLGWSCPELREPLGLEARTATAEILAFAPQIIVETQKDAQTFGRWLGKIYVADRELGEMLAERGLAVRS